MIETALQYAGRGWRVIPCRSDKVSRIRNWPVAASCDPATIIAWWTQWPNAWIALLCGCGFVVIDVDTGEAHNNVDGFGTLVQLGPLPEPRRVRTPTGGMHLYLKTDQPIRSRVIGPGLELRAAKPIRHRTAKSRLRGDLRRAADTVAGLAVQRAESGHQSGKETTRWPTRGKA